MATATKHWTIEELHSLPDDGNKYELIRGALFVTPAPTESHEFILARLTRLLDPYVERNNLGFVLHPRSVVRFEDSEVEPDLMVRQPRPDPDNPDWTKAPTPILVVEVASRSTRLRDRNEKRAFYRDAGVAEYWIVDGEQRAITAAKVNGEEVTVTEIMTWQPAGVEESVVFTVDQVLGEGRMRGPRSAGGA